MSARVIPFPQRGSAIVRESLGDAEVLHVFGDMDFSTAGELEAAIAGAICIDKRLVLDLLECRYIDSTIISVLVRSQKALGPQLRLIVEGTGTVQRVLGLTKLDRIFHLSQSLEDSLAS